MLFEVEEEWLHVHSGAVAGALALEDVTNPEHHPVLELEKAALEEELRTRFARSERRVIAALPVLKAYADYYKRFRKTYQVQAQLESVAFRGRSIPRVAALVEAMFMAELKNGILTGGHDLDLLEPPVTLKVSTGDEEMTLIDGRSQRLKPGDMYMGDQVGVISDVIYGLEKRTMIRPQTTRVFFSIYAPPGVPSSAVRAHMRDIVAYVGLFASGAKEVLAVVVSGAGTEGVQVKEGQA